MKICGTYSRSERVLQYKFSVCTYTYISGTFRKLIYWKNLRHYQEGLKMNNDNTDMIEDIASRRIDF